MALREELTKIYETHGELTPQLVVEVARDVAHPLHGRFEWDDTVAGEAYRRQQAQNLIRVCKIRFVTEDRVSEPVRAFSSVRGPEGYAYQPTTEVMADPLKVRMVLADMNREWQAMRRRYENYREFWELVRKDLPDGEVPAPIAS